MFKMSGIGVVIAGLAGSGLLYSAWSWDTTALKALTRSSPSPATEMPFVPGASLVLHSAAWRSFPAEPPRSEAAVLPAPASEAVMFPTAGSVPAGTAQPFARAEPRPTQAARASEPIQEQPNPLMGGAPQVEPAVQPMALETPAGEAPAPRERMSLAGPRIDTPEPVFVAASGRHPPRAVPGEPAPPPQPQVSVPAEPPKFGPERLKTFDGIGY
jgi:hypothetical protein